MTGAVLTQAASGAPDAEKPGKTPDDGERDVRELAVLVMIVLAPCPHWFFRHKYSLWFSFPLAALVKFDAS